MPCPYYRQVQLEGHHSWVHGYCGADATGRLRVPSVSEETHYCITKLYEDWYHLNNPGLKAYGLADCHDGGKLA